MKYVKQFLIIAAVTCAGEALHLLIDLPVPGSIYGLVILLLLLCLKVIKLEQVKDVGLLLVDIMPLTFIPAAVGVLQSWDLISGMLLPLCVIIPATTILVMLVTGKSTDLFLHMRKKDPDDPGDSDGREPACENEA